LKGFFHLINLADTNQKGSIGKVMLVMSSSTNFSKSEKEKSDISHSPKIHNDRN